VNMMGAIVAEDQRSDAAQADRRMGEMLWSAVRHGGLLDPDWWEAWSNGVQHSISIEGQILAVEMKPRDDSLMQDRGGRRWFADPLTKILIVRWHRDRLEYAGHVPLKECMALAAGPAAADDIYSGKFLKTAVNAWAFRLPGLILAFAKGRLPCESAPRALWEQALYACHRPVPATHRQAAIKRERGQAERVLLHTLSEELRALTNTEREYAAGRKAKANRKAAAFHAINRLPAPTHPLHQCLRHWCAYVLKHEKRGRHSKGYSPDTVRSYLKTLVRLFSGWGAGSPLDAPTGELEAFIVAFLDQAQGRVRADAVKAVISFLRFQAVQQPGAELHIDMNDYSEEDNAAPNLILPDGYRGTIRNFDRRGDDDHAMMVVLMFRAGLRMEEVAALQVGDVNVSDQHVELVVEANVERSLKTKTSRRILPLDVLLDHKELERLLARVRERRASSRFGMEAWLFGRAAAISPPDHREADRQVQKCLRDVTGFPDLTTAHLRHSFASYLLATLLLPPDAADIAVPTSLRTVISPGRAARVADRLVGRERLGAGALHAVSQIMGHTGPRTTLRYYCHLLDLSLGIFCNRTVSLVPIEDTRLLATTGVSADARRKSLARARVPAPSAGGEIHARPTSNDVTFWSPHTVRKVSDASLYASAFTRLARQLSRELATDVETEHLNAEREVANELQGKAAKGESSEEAPDPIFGRSREYGVPWRAIEASILTPALVSTDRHSAKIVERWRASARKLIPTEMAIATAVPASIELRRMIDQRLCLSRDPRRAERMALDRVLARWRRGYTDIRLSRLKDAQAFVELLAVMGFHQAEVHLELTSVRGYGMTSEDIHRFLFDRSTRPALSGRSGWRGSLIVRPRPRGIDHPVLGTRACRMALLMLAIDLDASRPFTSTRRTQIRSAAKSPSAERRNNH
jgi:site-specific recombinase XerD